MELSPGALIGRYQILSRLGAGGMGEVWKARDTRLERVVALKTLALRFNERFEREARAVAALNHPHICTLYDVGPDYLVMEYLEGAEIKGPLPPGDALRFAIQLAGALDAAHRKGVIHRDPPIFFSPPTVSSSSILAWRESAAIRRLLSPNPTRLNLCRSPEPAA